MSEKVKLRSHFKAKRSEYISKLSPAMQQLSFSNIPTPMRNIIEKSTSLASYIPVDTEANPLKITSIVREMGLQICLPYVTSKASPMQFFEWGINDPLEDGPMGLQQPSSQNRLCKPDVIIAPLVAFDRSFTRLGQGAGHYDRALSLLDKSIVIGLAWSTQEADELPYDPWDQKMDAVLTEKEWIIS